MFQEWNPIYSDAVLSEHLATHPDTDWAREGLVDVLNPADWWSAHRVRDHLRSFRTLGALQEDGSWRVIAPRFLDTKTNSLSLWLKPRVGDQIALLEGDPESVRTQTARVCSHIVQASGMHTPQACFTLLCGTYYLLNGDKGMEQLAEELSEALGWIPSLCVVGGPEFGSTKKRCMVGGYTTSSVVFGYGQSPDAGDAFVNFSPHT